MGPSLDLRFGILTSSPDMLFLTLSPALMVYSTPIAWALYAAGSVLAILNTRIALAFGLMALLFMDFSKQKTERMRSLIIACAFSYFCFQVWMLYQGFNLGWIP